MPRTTRRTRNIIDHDEHSIDQGFEKLSLANTKKTDRKRVQKMDKDTFQVAVRAMELKLQSSPRHGRGGGTSLATLTVVPKIIITPPPSPPSTSDMISIVLRDSQEVTANSPLAQRKARREARRQNTNKSIVSNHATCSGSSSMELYYDPAIYSPPLYIHPGLTPLDYPRFLWVPHRHHTESSRVQAMLLDMGKANMKAIGLERYVQLSKATDEHERWLAVRPDPTRPNKFKEMLDATPSLAAHIGCRADDKTGSASPSSSSSKQRSNSICSIDSDDSSRYSSDSDDSAYYSESDSSSSSSSSSSSKRSKSKSARRMQRGRSTSPLPISRGKKEDNNDIGNNDKVQQTTQQPKPGHRGKRGFKNSKNQAKKKNYEIVIQTESESDSEPETVVRAPVTVVRIDDHDKYYYLSETPPQQAGRLVVPAMPRTHFHISPFADPERQREPPVLMVEDTEVKMGWFVLEEEK